MSTFAVTAERLEVLPHPNADALELARVGAYHAVVRRGEYTTGDVAVYIPEQAILPADLITELGLTGRLAGPDANRVKAVRLRGELSQGIVCRPASLNSDELDSALECVRDFSDALSITKWVPTPPSSFNGELVSAPDFMPWIDIENIKRYPDIFVEGETVQATEKLHGSACCVTWDSSAGLMVSSKGLGSKYSAIVETAGNVYWRAVRTNGLADVCALIATRHNASRVGLYGEVYGPGIQDLHYGLDTPGFACFDARIVDTDNPGGRWLERVELQTVTTGLCNVVPTLYEGVYDFELLSAIAEGTETVSGSTHHLREGLVMRAVPERSSNHGRAIAKLVSGAYLTRKGGTEFE
jgi:RNA ligase (TIGR02306 family)